MYTVDLYLRVRLACHVDGLSQREAGQSVWHCARDGEEDAAAFGTAGISATPATETPETGPLHGYHRPYSGGRTDRFTVSSTTRRSVSSSAFATNMASRAKRPS